MVLDELLQQQLMEASTAQTLPTMDSVLADLQNGDMYIEVAKVYITRHMENVVDLTAQRGYFAGEVANAMLQRESSDRRSPKEFAESVLAMADALIEELKPKTE